MSQTGQADRAVTYGSPLVPPKRTWCSALGYSGGPLDEGEHILRFSVRANGREIRSNNVSAGGHDSGIYHIEWFDAPETGNYECHVTYDAGPYVSLSRQIGWRILYSSNSWRINTFVPGDNARVWPYDITYGGDNRGFSLFGGGDSRTITGGVFHHPRIDGSGFFEGPHYTTGQTWEYEYSTSVVGCCLTAEAINDFTWGPPLKTRWAQASSADLSCSMEEVSVTRENLRCTAEVNNPLFDWGAFNDITYDFTLALDWPEPPDSQTPLGAGPRYTLTGCHDGFPNYEIYVDGVTVYQFDHVAHGQTIWSLAPPCEWSVSRTGTIP